MLSKIAAIVTSFFIILAKAASFFFNQLVLNLKLLTLFNFDTLMLDNVIHSMYIQILIIRLKSGTCLEN